MRQGRTDAWIAHKLDVSIDQLARFKEDHDLNEGGGAPSRPADPLSVPPPEPEPGDEEPEDEEWAESELAEDEPTPPRPTRAETFGSSEPRAETAADEPDAEDGAPTGARRGRRRGRRGGRRRRARPSSYEATFDHGEEGYGLWLDPAIVENPVYAEHWAGRRAVKVTLDRDTITIRRADAENGGDSGA